MKVLVPQNFHKDGLKILQDAGLETKQVPARTEEDLAREVKDCDAIIAGNNVSRKVLESNPNLMVAARPGVGLETFDLKAATEMGIPVIFNGDATMETVAEHTIALILALARNIAKADKFARQGKWLMDYLREQRMLYDIEEKTLGVIGFGRIGRTVGEKAKALGMKVLAYDAFIKPEDIKKMGAEPADIPTILKTSDFVTLHTPLTDTTFHLMGKDQFAMMKKSAFLINASRGEVVDEKALIEALQNNVIAGAGIDVLEGWDPKPDNPIFKLDNVTLTPHIAYLSAEGNYRTVINVANDVVRAMRGENPKWVGNPEVLSKPNLRIKSLKKISNSPIFLFFSLF